MKSNPNCFRLLLIALLFVSMSGYAQMDKSGFPINGKNQQLTLYYDSSEPAIAFAANDLKIILDKKEINVQSRPLSSLPSNPEGMQIVIAQNDKEIIKVLKREGGSDVGTLNPQEYALRLTGSGNEKGYWVIGGDRIGAMYGGIHLGEIVKAFELDAVEDENQSPYIKKRGIKFNIPLDERVPSHDDRGTAAQANIENMWDFSFWTEYLDVLARQRYNVLSLWNKHPFPCMVKLDDYPEVALDDVYNKSGKVKEISIDQKIELWTKIMEYANDRGIEVMIITWNIHMNGAKGKYGITENVENAVTKDYLRKSVEKIFLTYPLLTGIGVTAGENMNDIGDDDKEQWLWDTYGKGIQDVQNVQTDRHIRFIHRYWWTSFDKIESRFGQLKDGFDMSFKYARAKMYAAYDPPFAEKELLPNLPEGMLTWWNIRNDDIYNLRWGNPEYAKNFILNLPDEDKTAGYYMGSDRYSWGRESISKNPLSQGVLENEKHWYSFLLWGRLGYDPETPVGLLKGLIKNRFPTVSSEDLFAAWNASSEVIPLVNKFHWFSWDYLWWPEAGISTGYGAAIDGYHDINDFIQAEVMDESDLITIVDYAEAVLENQIISGTTSLEVAEMLESYAKTALDKTREMSGGTNVELDETLGDIRAMAHLGNYYGKKIRGATYLKLFQDSKEKKYKDLALSNLEDALMSWKEYASVLESQYIKMNISMQGLFDWDEIEKEVKEDIRIVREAD
jgi:hypothetical protein